MAVSQRSHTCRCRTGCSSTLGAYESFLEVRSKVAGVGMRDLVTRGVRPVEPKEAFTHRREFGLPVDFYCER